MIYLYDLDGKVDAYTAGCVPIVVMYDVIAYVASGGRIDFQEAEFPSRDVYARPIGGEYHSDYKPYHFGAYIACPDIEYADEWARRHEWKDEKGRTFVDLMFEGLLGIAQCVPVMPALLYGQRIITKISPDKDYHFYADSPLERNRVVARVTDIINK